MKKLLSGLLLIMVLLNLTSCSLAYPDYFTEQSTEASDLDNSSAVPIGTIHLETQSTIPATTAPETQPSTEATEDTVPAETTTETVETIVEDLSLNVEPGRYKLRYNDEKSGDYLDYHVFIPQNPRKDLPLITFLHGMGEVDQIDKLANYGIANVITQLYGQDFPFIMIMPCTHVKTWIKDGVPEVLKGLLDHVVSEYQIDTDHIIMTGHSLGAIGTWKMVSLYGDYFSAAVPVSCGIDDELNFSNFQNIPVWGFVGTDGFYEENYNKAMVKIVDAVNANGGNAKLTIYEGIEHHETIAMPYTLDLFNWMLAQ